MSVLVEHGGFGAEAAAPSAREIMRVALLKDPEVRARIEQPRRASARRQLPRRRTGAGRRPASAAAREPVGHIAGRTTWLAGGSSRPARAASPPPPLSARANTDVPT